MSPHTTVGRPSNADPKCSTPTEVHPLYMLAAVAAFLALEKTVVAATAHRHCYSPVRAEPAERGTSADKATVATPWSAARGTPLDRTLKAAPKVALD